MGQVLEAKRRCKSNHQKPVSHEQLELHPSPLSLAAMNYEKNAETKGILYTDKIVKFFLCIFYGIIPRWFRSHHKKLHSVFASVFIIVLHWFAVGGYIYCNRMFWSSTKANNATAPTNTDALATLPKIPEETLLLLVGLSLSGAITITMAIHYFYSNSNNFSTQNNFSILPRIDTTDDSKPVDIGSKDWLEINIIFIFGIASIVFILGTNLGTGTMFNFYGIREFLSHTTISNKIIYYTTLTMLFWGFTVTVCACCIFHIMARNLIANINETQRLILETATSREDFFRYHEGLLKYRDKVVGKFKYWFAIHNVLYILLVGTMIFEWTAFMKSSKYQQNNILSQVSGTVLICYKFVFPFVSASLVTVKFKDFYITIARSNKFSDIPELLLLPNYFGFEIFGLRITPNVAVIVFLSSFVGFLKYVMAAV